MSCFNLSLLPTSSLTLNLTVARSILGGMAKRLPNNAYTDPVWIERMDRAILAAGHEFCNRTRIYQATDESLTLAADATSVDASGLTALDPDKVLSLSTKNAEDVVDEFTLVGHTAWLKNTKNGKNQNLAAIDSAKTIYLYPSSGESRTVIIRYWKPFEMDFSHVGSIYPDNVLFALPVEIATGVFAYGAVAFFDQDVVDESYAREARTLFENHIRKYLSWGQESVQAVISDRSNY